MDIKRIMNDSGEIDWMKIIKLWRGSEDISISDMAEAINAHIASLTQETPITPELLKRAGFEIYAPGIWLKTVDGVSVIFNERVFLEDDRSLIKLPHIVTMEALSELHKGLTGQPLNWQHDPAAELRKRLEAMGFESDDKVFFWLCVSNLHFSVWINAKHLVVWLASTPGVSHQKLTGIKTIDALERVVKELRGE